MHGYPELYKISNTLAFLQLTKRTSRRHVFYLYPTHFKSLQKQKK